MNVTPSNELRLEPIAGPALSIPPIAPGKEVVLGRRQDCDAVLNDEAVSRRHATVAHRSQRWVLCDLGSRHGTFLNGVKLAPNQPAVLDDGDVVSIGPWAFRATTGQIRSTITMSVDDADSAAQRIERVSPARTARLAQHRLELIIECAAAITGATDEATLAQAALASALAGSGFDHAVLLRPLGSDGQVEVLGYHRRDGASTSDIAGEVTFSRSLLLEAGRGEIVRMAALADVPMHASIAELGITAALCAPVMLSSAIAAYLYLDARGTQRDVAPDAAAFCGVIARLCGLALANLKRIQLEQRQRKLEEQVQAARAAQLLILPPEHGQVSGIRYAMTMRPGQFVAGDLFDVMPLDDDRAAVCIGDVAGHGVGSAVVMAATQAHLNAALRRGDNVQTAVKAVNRYLGDRCSPNLFVSLWVGIFDRRDRGVTFVDAGHGYWLHKPHDEPARFVQSRGGIPIGIDPTFDYQPERITLARGDRLILFSDGAVEQNNPRGEQFSRVRIAQAISSRAEPADDVQLIFASLTHFAATSSFDDDTTVASVAWGDREA